MPEIINSWTDNKFRLKRFISSLKRTINKKEEISSNEIIVTIKKNSLNDDELFEIFKIIESALKQDTVKNLWNKDEYENLLKDIKIIFWERYLIKIKKEIKTKVATIIKEWHNYELKAWVPDKLREIYFYFSSLVHQNEIKKEEMQKLNAMLRNVFTSLKYSEINSERISDIKNLIRTKISKMLDTINPSEIIWIYEKFNLLVCDEKKS